MNTLQATRIQDQSQRTGDHSEATQLNHSFFLGVWQNTNSNAKGILQVEFKDKTGALSMRVIGAGETEPIVWNEIEVKVLTDDVDSTNGTKFAAVHNFDFMQIRMHGWVKLGVLVIAVLNRFTDDSGRSNYFDREFFYAEEKI